MHINAYMTAREYVFLRNRGAVVTRLRLNYRTTQEIRRLYP